MSCCGRKRHLESGVRSVLASRRSWAPAHPPLRYVDDRRAAVLFEYLGATALSARGPRTRRLYRFGSEGAVVAVDPRDADAIAKVPGLRRLAT